MSLFSNTNELIHESSPYLLQHAHNPVQWHAWNEKTLLKARKENKLILISIGYATCHWCHVMEAESFEDKEVAKLMNQHFICIKVDREERPDVDQLYMDAVQLLTGRGGWPLHAITLPDTRPFWGGTYFPKQNWMGILTEIARIWEQEPQKIHEYAENLTLGIQQKDLFTRKTENSQYSLSTLKSLVNKWSQNFDHQWGGMNRAPKFPLPNNYLFLLRFAVQSEDPELLEFVKLTLTKMAYGGIFDPIRGGFARYSTDIKWHVPHFEKMLYDNAQLISLYSDAYLISQNTLYQEVVEKTLKFIENELFDTEYFGFYSALDADSLNEKDHKEEGAFYVWKAHEIEQILGNDFDLFSKYYNLNPLGYWEAENYVLIRTQSDEEFCAENQLTLENFQKSKTTWHEKLYQFQSKRSHPFLDDKMLTSWNALMCKGFADAYRVFGNAHYLKIAEKNMQFILSYLQKPDGGLYRNFKNGTAKINAYLEDYATVVEALLTLHEVTLDEKYVHQAKQFTDYTLDHFSDLESGFFFFTSDEDTALIHRKADVPDDVIPSGNSIMARNLFKMSHLFSNEHYKKVSLQMLNNVWDNIPNYPSGFSNWLLLVSDVLSDYYEIVITGEKATSVLQELNQHYIPNKLLTGSAKDSEMPLLKNRFDSEKTLIFVCVNNTCLLPETSVEKAVQPIKRIYNAY